MEKQASNSLYTRIKIKGDNSVLSADSVESASSSNNISQKQNATG
jgi:hypothetical protein